jgi:hypothetical protein
MSSRGFAEQQADGALRAGGVGDDIGVAAVVQEALADLTMASARSSASAGAR